MTDDQIFQKAMQLPPQDRTAFLTEACQGRPEQRNRLIKLVEAAQHDDSLLDPAVADSTLDHVPGTALDRVGNYRLLQQIGEGGFGIVYMAGQTKPIRRKHQSRQTRHGFEGCAGEV